MSPDARVLVVGAGGLGVPATFALLEAGVSSVTVLDPDRVEVSNLHRQVVYQEDDVGRCKVHALADAASRYATRLRLEPAALKVQNVLFTADTVSAHAQYDVILDCTDAPETKMLISDVGAYFGVSTVYAGVVGTDARALLTRRPGAHTCLRCVFGHHTPKVRTNCERSGVLGPLAGFVGVLQAEMAVAALENDARFDDRIFVYGKSRDAGRGSERWVRWPRQSGCAGCGKVPELRAPASGPLRAGDKVPDVDLRGLVCPETYTQTRRKLEPLDPGRRIWLVLSSDESARQVPLSAQAAGHRVLARQSEGGVHRILIERGPQAPDASSDGSGGTGAERALPKGHEAL